MANYWITQSITGTYSYAVGVAADALSNTFVLSVVDNGSSTDGVLSKYSKYGVLQWQRVLKSPYGVDFSSATTDSSGNCYAAGVVYDSGNKGSVLLVKYNTAGTVQWQRTLTAASNSAFSFSVTTDASGNVYLAGYNGTSPFSSFLVKYNSSGTLQWQRNLSGSSCLLYSVTVSPNGKVFAGGLVYSGATPQALLVQYNTSGALQWQKRLYISGQQSAAKSVVADSSDNCYFVGYYTVSGVANVLLTSYDSSGTLQWQQGLSGVIYAGGNGIALDASNNLCVAGFAAGYGTDNGGLLAKYDDAGTILWQTYLDSSGPPNLSQVAVDVSGNFNAVGINGSSNDLFVKLPGDGSGAGTYGPFTYAAATLPDAAPGATDDVTSLTDAAESLTDAAGAVTSTAFYDLSLKA